MRYTRYYILLIILSISFACKAQEDSLRQALEQFPERSVAAINDKLAGIDKKLSKQTTKALRKFERQEAKLQRKLAAKDSTLNTIKESAQKLEQLQNEFTNIPDKAINKLQGEYNAYLDTLKTTFKFLQQKDGVIGKSKELQDKLTQATSQLNILEGKLQKAEEIKKYLRERKEILRQQLEKFSMVKQLKQIEKTTYYYNEYIKEYKNLLKDRKKLEQKAMALLYSTPIFKKFVEKNSLLARLFRIPSANSGSDAATIPVLQGLQTRVNVQQMMQERVATGGPNALTQVRQQIQSAQGELNKLKDKIAKYGSADAEIPSFKPNSQKTKSLLRRLTYEANIQFSKSNKLLPSQSDIALGVGYKLNDKGVIGIASSVKLGLGTGWNNIKLSTQGLSLRSYLDWKIKGNFYASGGYEQNYYSQINNFSSWQSSGLMGVSKKLKMKGNRSAKFQLLYDFLSYKHVPVTQPFIFRTGFTFK
jgi:DNA repair exonuclease SbcCD ATPase subunit